MQIHILQFKLSLFTREYCVTCQSGYLKPKLSPWTNTQIYVPIKRPKAFSHSNINTCIIMQIRRRPKEGASSSLRRKYYKLFCTINTAGWSAESLLPPPFWVNIPCEPHHFGKAPHCIAYPKIYFRTLKKTRNQNRTKVSIHTILKQTAMPIQRTHAIYHTDSIMHYYTMAHSILVKVTLQDHGISDTTTKHSLQY